MFHFSFPSRQILKPFPPSYRLRFPLLTVSSHHCFCCHIVSFHCHTATVSTAISPMSTYNKRAYSNIANLPRARKQRHRTVLEFTSCAAVRLLSGLTWLPLFTLRPNTPSPPPLHYAQVCQVVPGWWWWWWMVAVSLHAEVTEGLTNQSLPTLFVFFSFFLLRWISSRAH